MFEDINETAKDLAGVITRMEDAETVASVIRNALVVERTAHMPDVNQVVPLLVFLYYLMEEKGGNLMYGSRTLDEAFDAACTLSKIDKTKIIETFKND
ncbi:hypothetical protein PHIM7_218 [Sinorhizobium phage phiM7]|uniref:Uncharacterized protein n=2 Tax=Emdodecavirus TaxID=1980937 RepID=A0A0F6SJ31_9CAUD|nr:hypothetical protein AVT40_gp303 [Sinorhizobium phage phiN3]YP_009601343.1 hypothetical protein FDH46_gp260 [Sinorhizobium phage phiM7]AKF12763.1 hypothetical protein PHIM7_218 [Sinorhizobium phage phiM7]AKF13493.2 hypothetical protein PHIN3_230 [Sinorhizobium phage phiN3]